MKRSFSAKRHLTIGELQGKIEAIERLLTVAREALRGIQITSTQASVVCAQVTGSESLAAAGTSATMAMAWMQDTEAEAGLLTLLSSSLASWKAFSLAALAVSFPFCRSYSQKITAEAVCTGKTWCGLGYIIGIETLHWQPTPCCVL